MATAFVVNNAASLVPILSFCDLRETSAICTCWHDQCRPVRQLLGDKVLCGVCLEDLRIYRGECKCTEERVCHESDTSEEGSFEAITLTSVFWEFNYMSSSAFIDGRFYHPVTGQRIRPRDYEFVSMRLLSLLRTYQHDHGIEYSGTEPTRNDWCWFGELWHRIDAQPTFSGIQYTSPLYRSWEDSPLYTGPRSHERHGSQSAGVPSSQDRVGRGLHAEDGSTEEATDGGGHQEDYQAESRASRHE